MTIIIPRAKLAQLDTSSLIEQYELIQANYGKRYNSTGPTRLQLRINYIVDLISARADNDDAVALRWCEET